MTDERPVGFEVPDWSPAATPPDTALEGRTVRLEPLDPDAHAGPLHEAFAGHDWLWDYMACGPFASAQDYRRWLVEASRGGDPRFYVMRTLDDGRCCGIASFLRIDPAMGTIEIGHICMAPRLQRTVPATEALFAMIDWAFGAGYRRCEWKCNALNAPSRAAALRLGFSFEGVFRQAMVVKGRNRDTAWYAIIDRDWPGLRDGFRAWLSPGNFDAEGRQRTRLGAHREGAGA